MVPGTEQAFLKCSLCVCKYFLKAIDSFTHDFSFMKWIQWNHFNMGYIFFCYYTQCCNILWCYTYLWQLLQLLPCLCVCLLRHAQLFVTLWTVACQAPLLMEFSRQKYWSRLPFPPGDLPYPGIKPASPVLAGGFFTTVSPGKPNYPLSKYF